MKNRVKSFIVILGTFAGGFFLGSKILVNMINEYKSGMERSSSNMKVFHQWLSFLYSGGQIETYLRERHYSRIMIYGNGYVGKSLLQALEKTDISVAAGMDRNVPVESDDMIIGTDSIIPDVDAIVVTPVFYFNEICSMLREKTELPIISIEEMFRL